MRTSSDWAERRDWTIEQYHGDRTAHSNSSLKMAVQTDGLRWRFTPTRFRAWSEGRIPARSKKAFEFGTAVHAAMEGTLNSVVRIGPEAAKNTTEWKDWVKEQRSTLSISELARVVFMKPSEAQEIKGVYDSIMSHPVVSKMFEQKVVATEGTILFGAFGDTLKTRPDLELQYDVPDWKTSNDPFDWLSSAYEYGYHRQAKIQQRAIEILSGELKSIKHVVIGKEFPYHVVVHELPKRDLDLGWDEVGMILERIQAWRGFAYPDQAWEREVCRQGLPDYYHAAKTIEE